MESQFILIVENNLIDRMMISDDLKKEGFSVRFAPDAQTALRILIERRPFLILIGLIDSKMDYNTFVSILKNDEDTKSIPIMAFGDSGQDYTKSKHGNFDGWIHTKGSSEIFTTEIKKILTNREQ